MSRWAGRITVAKTQLCPIGRSPLSTYIHQPRHTARAKYHCMLPVSSRRRIRSSSKPGFHQQVVSAPLTAVPLNSRRRGPCPDTRGSVRRAVASSMRRASRTPARRRPPHPRARAGRRNRTRFSVGSSCRPRANSTTR